MYYQQNHIVLIIFNNPVKYTVSVSVFNMFIQAFLISCVFCVVSGQEDTFLGKLRLYSYL